MRLPQRPEEPTVVWFVQRSCLYLNRHVRHLLSKNKYIERERAETEKGREREIDRERKRFAMYT